MIYIHVTINSEQNSIGIRDEDIERSEAAFHGLCYIHRKLLQLLIVESKTTLGVYVMML